MLNVLIATSPDKCVYTVASINEWTGWSSIPHLNFKTAKPFPASVSTFDEFYTNCKNNNKEYTIKHIIVNSFEHLQELHPEFFI